MKRLLVALAAAGLLLMPTIVLAENETIAKSPPPVSQALVREGDFAVELAGALGIGSPGTEAEAEDLLSKAGISPKNGWIADYPITPDVLGELYDSVGSAADSKAIAMDRGDAEAAFRKLAEKHGLVLEPARDVAASNGAEFGEYSSSQVEDYGQYYEPVVIENYYYEYGPPVVTYYSPPWDYWYLYSWVSYPFWCYGYYYPGYYILNDFHVTVNVNLSDGGTGVAVVTNHVTDPVTGTVSEVRPPNAVQVSGSEGRQRDRGDRITGTRSFSDSAGSIITRSETRRDRREMRQQPDGAVNNEGAGTFRGTTGRTRLSDADSIGPARNTRTDEFSGRGKMLGYRDRTSNRQEDIRGKRGDTSEGRTAVTESQGRLFDGADNRRFDRRSVSREPSSRSFDRARSIGSPDSQFNRRSVSREPSSRSFDRGPVSRDASDRSFSRPSASRAPVERSFSRPSASSAPVERSFSRPSASRAPERSFSRPSASRAPERSFSRPSGEGRGSGGGGFGRGGCKGGRC